MFDLVSLIKAIGYAGIFGIVFAESGLFFGFFLPGDSLLFTAGFLASQGFFDITILAFTAFFAAVLGDSVGYAFGYRVGPKIFTREDSLFFHKDHLERARVFYERHGGKTIVIARFMPFVRTFAPIVAGVGKMRYGTFLFYNIFGGIIWGIGITSLGYYLGNTIPNVDRYIIPIVLLIIFSSVLPPLYHLMKDKQQRKRIMDYFRKKISKV
ncbi:MAG: VTT domain-containing protein [Patescibacteria group bacterium]